jgi:hypothetical protein
MAARQRYPYPRRNILIINGQTSATSTPSAAKTFLQTKEKEEKTDEKLAFSPFFLYLCKKIDRTAMNSLKCLKERP